MKLLIGGCCYQVLFGNERLFYNRKEVLYLWQHECHQILVSPLATVQHLDDLIAHALPPRRQPLDHYPWTAGWFIEPVTNRFACCESAAVAHGVEESISCTPFPRINGQRANRRWAGRQTAHSHPGSVCKPFLTALRKKLASVRPDEMDKLFGFALRNVARLTNADRSFFFPITDWVLPMDQFQASAWSVSLLERQPTGTTCDRANSSQQLHDYLLVDLPDANVVDCSIGGLAKLLADRGTRSLLSVAVRSGNVIRGHIGIETVAGKRRWQRKDMQLLGVVGRMMAALGEPATVAI